MISNSAENDAEEVEIDTPAMAPQQMEVAVNESNSEPSAADSACQSNPMSQTVSRSSSRLDDEKQEMSPNGNQYFG